MKIQAHMRTANSQALVHTCVHTQPLRCPSLHTVSGRFLSLSSLRSKHWLMMGFSELHMVCESRAGLRVGPGSNRTHFWGKKPYRAHPQALPMPSSPHLLQVPEEKVIVFIQKPWEDRADVRESSSACSL